MSDKDWQNFDEVMDGIIRGCCVGVGIAALIAVAYMAGWRY